MFVWVGLIFVLFPVPFPFLGWICILIFFFFRFFLGREGGLLRMWYFDPGYCPNVGMETTVLLIEEETGNFYPEIGRAHV